MATDTIWWQRFGSTLVQVMACCLTASSQYLGQCWLIISNVQWHSSEGNFRRDTLPSIAKITSKVTYLNLKITPTFPRGQWVRMAVCQRRVKFQNISAWQKLITIFQQLAINRSNFNLNLPHQWHHMASLGHNELNSYLAVSLMLSQSWTESDTTTSLVPKGLNSIPTGLISTNQLA